jgi:hypothetical protein
VSRALQALNNTTLAAENSAENSPEIKVFDREITRIEEQIRQLHLQNVDTAALSAKLRRCQRHRGQALQKLIDRKISGATRRLKHARVEKSRLKARQRMLRNDIRNLSRNHSSRRS